ncbi:larval cuticle protein A2B-like [Topomyia yanbarensis]|uniref:larval cuticle protein A2B-like n=1 Tax=Topomyia yanbarensis TaxID=2498891 RepID=UPI00273B17FD|nr:larval cuticle protein A2B-like [Topomyia yanbarensis]
MAFKFLILCAVVAIARAGYIAAPVPLTYAAAPIVKTVEYDANPQYAFSYGVSDGLTGDQKSQQESRSGDVVQGSYSVVDPDGFKRTVDYSADPLNGFNAAVRREPIGVPVVAAVAPVVYSAPIVKTVVAQPAMVQYAAQPIVGSYARH